MDVTSQMTSTILPNGLGKNVVVPMNDAPTFSFTTYDGRQVISGELDQKVIVVGFWASWCSPCLLQMSELQMVREQYSGNDVIVLGIAYVDMDEYALKAARDMQITFPIGSDNGTEISDVFGVEGIPEVFVIDKQRQIKTHFVDITSAATLSTTIDEILRD